MSSVGLWQVIMNTKPRLPISRLTIEEFLENYPLLKASGELEFYNDYLKLEKRIITHFSESFLNYLLQEKRYNLNNGVEKEKCLKKQQKK